MRFIPALLIAAALAAGEAPPVKTPAPVPVLATTAAKAYLGVAIDPAASAFDAKGLRVLRVEPASPAAVMGIQAGDCILSVDGTAVKTQDELGKVLGGHKPGDTVKLDVLRAQGKDGLPQTIAISGVLQEQPRSRTANLGSQLADLQSRIADLSGKGKEPTLAEVLQKLQDIEEQLPRAAEQFKRIYPNGEFRIAISVEITSDKKAADPLDIEVGGKPGDMKVDAPKLDAQPKGEAPKPDAPKP